MHFYKRITSLYLGIFLLFVGATVLATGCSKKSTVTTTESGDEIIDGEIVTTTQPYVYNPSTIENNSARSVAEGFIEAIKNKDFATARSLINLSDGNLLTTEDVEYVVRRTLIGYMIGNPESQVYGASYYENSGKATYSFYTDPNYNYNYSYSLSLSLNDNNEWKLNKISFVKDYTYCYVPEGVRLYLDGEEVPASYKVKTDNNTDVYKLPELARKDHDTMIVSSIFGEIKGTISIPVYNPNNPDLDKDDTPIEVYRQITPELFNTLGERVKTIYNTIYKMMDNDDSAENLNPFITTQKNYKFLEEKYQAGLSARLSYVDGITHAKTNVEILEFWQNPAVSSYIYSSDTIVVNMVLSIRWNEGDAVRSEYICSGTKLTKEAGGEWLLNDITKGAWTTLQPGLDESKGVNAW